MIKKYALVFLVSLCFILSGFGQSIFTNPITGTNPNTANPYTTGQTVNPNITVSGIGRGPGITGTNANNRYNANGFDTPAIDLTAYFEFTLTPNTGYEIDFLSFVYIAQASGTGPTSFEFRSSLDSFIANIGTSSSTGATISLTPATYQNITSAVTFRLYGRGASAGGGTFSVNDFTFNGTVTSTSTAAVDFCNLQFPEVGSIPQGTPFDVYARVYEMGITSNPGADPAIEAWIGYSTTNTDPDTWTNWIPATYSGQFGNDDQYTADIGSSLPVGEYYYASRFRLSGGSYSYGGILSDGSAGNFWDGVTYISCILTVDVLDYYNLQFPATGNITTTTDYNVYAQVYEPNLTVGPGQGANIQVWIGYSTTNSNPSGAGWTWVLADYNPSSSGNNDEYFVNLGDELDTPNTYYYASRFQLSAGPYTYGGILANGNPGDQWDGNTYINGVVNVTAENCAELFISEYVEGSSNNKFIEIYNPNSTSVTLTGNYTLDIYSNGATSGTTINLVGTISANGKFIIKNTSATLGVTANQASPNLTFNGNDAVALLRSGVNIDVIGQIGNDPGAAWTGGGCSTVNRTLRRKSNIQVGDANGSNAFDPSIQWDCYLVDDISDLGFHTSSCASTNELQLEFPIATDISCGYTHNFGVQLLNSNTDIVVRIRNLGVVNLNISSLDFVTGSAYSLVSPPATPFSIAGGAYHDITIRFNPNSIGLFLDTLTIVNDDASEAICSFNLSGTGSTTCATTTTIIAAQDFESSGTDTWNYTPDHSPIANYWYVTNALTNNSVNISTAQSNTNFWGMSDLDRSGHRLEDHIHEITFDAVDISIYSSVQLSFHYYTLNLDNSDTIEYQLFYDGVPQGFVDLSENTNAWSEVLINIPETVNSFHIKFYAAVDAANDQVGLDNFLLTSTYLNIAAWDGNHWIWNEGTAIDTPPNSSTTAVLNGNYNTSINNSFSACSLIVNSGATLTVANGDFVDILNDVIVNGNDAINFGEIVVATQGSFIQQGIGVGAGIFTINGTGKSQVNKFTAPLQTTYDYTYWSSPVVNATVDVALFSSNPSRRFWFNAANYFDSDGDDFDEEGDDWTQVTGAADAYNTMTAGRGYASTHGNVGFIPNNSYQYIFEGSFNTGDISYPLAYNVGNTDHWNLVGNPYPSAIDVDQLFLENTSIKDVVYLWSHFRAPDAANPGNEVLNFNQNDYLVINATMEIGNGSDLNGDGFINGLDIPQRAIPSGQSFFVSSTSNNPIVFNNAMRISGDNANDDFYREDSTSSSAPLENRLWINLTSDDGAYSQTGIGYVSGATAGYDGIAYDAKRNLSYENAAIIYTTIPNSAEIKFAIQGKNTADLSLDEMIPLGFSTNLNTPTTYRINLLKTSGEFVTSNYVFIKDKLLNSIHNISISEYIFSSESGEFNDRFEIVFKNSALSIIDNEIPASALTIIELPNGQVKFSVSNALDIKAVEIIDMLGRTLYQLDGNSPTEIYDLSNLSQAAYIAKVRLSNGQVITKRAVKRY